MKKSAAVFVIRDDDMVLMEWRDDHPFSGKLSFPGGKIEDGEDWHDALLREAREELGIEILDATPIPEVYSGTWTIYPWLVTRYDGPIPEETDAGAELHWIHIDEACEVPWPPARQIAIQVRTAIVATL
jgi:8-oxo-dGTP diphosphatase